MKGMLDLAIVIDQACGDATEGGCGGNGGGDSEVLWFIDPSNVARRGAQSTVVGEGDVTRSFLRLLDSRGETLQAKEGGFATSMIDSAPMGSQYL